MPDERDPNQEEPRQPLHANIPADYFERFVQELNGINLTLKSIQSLIPEQTADFAKQVGEFYERGTSGRESRPEERTRGYQSRSDYASNVDPAAKDPHDPQVEKNMLRAIGDAFKTAAKEKSYTAGMNDWLAAQSTPRLSNLGAPHDPASAGSMGRYSQQAPPPPPPPRDGVPSSGASDGGEGGGEGGQVWRKFIKEGLANEPLQMPRIGEFTPADLLDFMGDVTARSALKRQSSLEGQIREHNAPLQRDLDNLSPDAPEEERQNILDQMRDLGEAQDDSDVNRRGVTAGFLYKAAEFAPKAALVHQFASKLGIQVHPTAFAAAGSSLGVSGQPANVTIPGTDIGMQLPIPFLNPAVTKGMQEEFEMQKMRASAGINEEQARSIFNNLYGLGWTGGDRTNVMRDSLESITKWNPTIGTDPRIAELQDQSLREGATSAQDFVGVIKQIPDAAHAAHVSIDQMISDMQAAGELNRSTGGTVAQGMQNAQVWSGITGQPSALWPELAQNPWVQTQATMRSGLLPFEQGLESSGQRVTDITSALRMSYNAAGNGLPGVRSPVPGTSFSNKVSGEDRRLAWVQQQFPELDVPTIRNLLHNQKNIDKGAHAEDLVNQWSGEVTRATKAGDLGKVKSLMSSQGLDHNWGGVKNYLHQAMRVDPKTHKVTRMFSNDEIKEIDEAGKVGHYVKTKHPGGWGAPTIPGHWEGKSPIEAAHARLAKLNHIQASKGQKNVDGPHVTIELSKNAKKLFKLKSNDAKDNAGAGGTLLNVALGLQPTQILNNISDLIG